MNRFFSLLLLVVPVSLWGGDQLMVERGQQIGLQLNQPLVNASQVRRSLHRTGFTSLLGFSPHEEQGGLASVDDIASKSWFEKFIEMRFLPQIDVNQMHSDSHPQSSSQEEHVEDDVQDGVEDDVQEDLERQFKPSSFFDWAYQKVSQSFQESFTSALVEVGTIALAGLATLVFSHPYLTLTVATVVFLVSCYALYSFGLSLWPQLRWTATSDTVRRDVGNNSGRLGLGAPGALGAGVGGLLGAVVAGHFGYSVDDHEWWLIVTMFASATTATFVLFFEWRKEVKEDRKRERQEAKPYIVRLLGL